ncbi:MAG: FliA/WhiG family RNA polymerase sigma factor [Phycisphaerae bacterium]|jgi:RNA polymerase sigma factor for flagellar operon FliA
METKFPSLDTYDKYGLEALILSDLSLCRWFADVCMDQKPTIEVGEELLALIEGHGLVRKRDKGWVLSPDGRQFARRLGIIPGPSKYETNPLLIREIKAKSEEALNCTADQLDSIEKVWEKFFKERSEELRNKLMEHYLPLVKYTAERMYVKLPDKVEIDDLVSAGIFGLMDAIDAFNPKRGVKFATYCTPRIRGAILDELRGMDWVPRSTRVSAHLLGNAMRTLQAHLGRLPTEQEIAKELKIDIEEFHRLQLDATAAGMVPLINSFDAEGDNDICEIDIEDKKNKDPMVEAQKRDLKSFLTKDLTKAERQILILYYYEEMTIKQIGSVLDLSESRVAQMHSSIIARLKISMNTRKEDF